MGAGVSVGYLLDTTHCSQAVVPGSPLRDLIRDKLANGIRIGICMPILCEIEAGIPGVRDPNLYRRHLNAFLQRIRLWPFDGDAAREYGIITNDLRQRGRALSQVDRMVAALARQMRLVLVTADNDFEALPDIPKEKWGAP